ncbi:hypothetical protein SSP531S_08070 [Streptomyces spongiicola]|uniref:Uncharacterized protein n=1 Tax=Streptomyces spongiicola TaxID=1690221 RepID=A0A388SS09_9ACTN|nr:hypothetical protein SSP531S_08070 [Streptomyces spongiicola]
MAPPRHRLYSRPPELPAAAALHGTVGTVGITNITDITGITGAPGRKHSSPKPGVLSIPPAAASVWLRTRRAPRRTDRSAPFAWHLCFSVKFHRRRTERTRSLHYVSGQGIAARRSGGSSRAAVPGVMGRDTTA